MQIYLELLTEQAAEELLVFEVNNRSFFEKMVPSRGDNYYLFETFKVRHKELLDEQKKGISYFYLIRNELNSIVGRINLVDINHDKQIAHIGYRIAEAYTRKGIAKKALELLIMEIENYSIKEIHAKTTSHNIASQKVLEQNGFLQDPIFSDEMEWNGQILQFVHFIWKKEIV